jgi:hypothetical protein
MVDHSTFLLLTFNKEIESILLLDNHRSRRAKIGRHSGKLLHALLHLEIELVKPVSVIVIEPRAHEFPWRFMTFMVRSGEAGLPALAAAVRREALAQDKDVPVVDMKTETQVVSQVLFLDRAFAALSSAFGFLALALACVGLYGTMLVGIAVGLPAAWTASNLLKARLFGLRPHDPWSITLAIVATVIVTAVAGYIPAKRASRVDPMVALRYE